MHRLKNWGCVRAAAAAAVLVAAVLLAGCGLFKASRRISVPQPLTPLVEADMPQMFEEINRLGAVKSLNGRVDIQFLDTSYAECGLAEKYRTAYGRLSTWATRSTSASSRGATPRSTRSLRPKARASRSTARPAASGASRPC